jgi:hypothetical protein
MATGGQMHLRNNHVSKWRSKQATLKPTAKTGLSQFFSPRRRKSHSQFNDFKQTWCGSLKDQGEDLHLKSAQSEQLEKPGRANFPRRFQRNSPKKNLK